MVQNSELLSRFWFYDSFYLNKHLVNANFKVLVENCLTATFQILSSRTYFCLPYTFLIEQEIAEDGMAALQSKF